MFKIFIRITLLLAGLGLALQALLGADRILNGVTAGDQTQPALGDDGTGAMVVVWVSAGQDGGLSGLYARRLDQNGDPDGIDFQAHTFWAPHESPRIAMNPLGRFVVTATNYWIEGDTSGAVAALIFDPSGGAPDQEFQINLETAGYQGEPDAAMDGSGNLLIVWQSDGGDGDGCGVLARRFDQNGNALSTEIRVNQETGGNQFHPAVAMESSGSFVVAWAGENPDTGHTSIFARRFDRDGSPLSEEFQVAGASSGWRDWPAIAMDATGGFVIAWHGFTEGEEGYDIYARTYDRTASLKGPETLVNEQTSGWQIFPAVDVDADGDFLIAWQGREPDQDPYGIFARLFDHNSEALGDEFQVNNAEGGSHEHPDVSLYSSQVYTIVWQAKTDTGDGWDIHGRTFGSPSQPSGPPGTRIVKRDEKKKPLHRPSRTDRDPDMGDE